MCPDMFFSVCCWRRGSVLLMLLPGDGWHPARAMGARAWPSMLPPFRRAVLLRMLSASQLTAPLLFPPEARLQELQGQHRARGGWSSGPGEFLAPEHGLRNPSAVSLSSFAFSLSCLARSHVNTAARVSTVCCHAGSEQDVGGG